MRITRKKYIKLLMSIGFTKNEARKCSTWTYYYSTSYNKLWNAYLEDEAYEYKYRNV